MRHDLTDITVLIDRSGSMQSIRDDVTGGIEDFIEQQKKASGTAHLTVILFDSHDPQEVVIPTQDVRLVHLERDWFRPRGMTPLCDAIGHAVENTGRRLAALPEHLRPSRVVFVVFTDGNENDSKRFSRERVAEMVKHQEAVYNWQFLFMGAGIDAIGEAEDVGINAMRSASTARTKTRMSMGMAASKVATYRSCQPSEGVAAFTAQERELLS